MSWGCPRLGIGLGLGIGIGDIPGHPRTVVGNPGHTSDKHAEGGSGRLPIPFWIQIMQHLRDVTLWTRPHDAKSKPVDIHLAIFF